MNERGKVLTDIAGQILRGARDGMCLVAVDGVDGAGKTTFADELAETLRSMSATVMRASVDSFHHPRSIRYRQGRDSPHGFFDDSYDYATLKRVLLDPLTARRGRICRAAFDYRRDAKVVAETEEVPERGVLVFDGIFLHRPELRPYWQFSVFLDVPFHVSIPRAARRGEGSPDPSSPVNRRYVDGQSLYLSRCNPRALATVVVNNETLDASFIAARNGRAAEPTAGYA